MKLFKKGLLSLAVLLTSSIAHGDEVTNNQSYHSSLSVEDCHIKGVKQFVKCGKLTVPENYQKPKDKQIELNFVILPAIDNSEGLEPMMFLAGGPGQAATELAGSILQSFNETRKTRDIIMVDQRGTGKSATLECKDVEIPDPYTSIAEELNLDDVKKCLTQFEYDLSQFGSENAIRDFEQVRLALGHEQINLYGGSYGTRAALVYMRLYPQSLRSVVLDSVGPIEVPIGVFGQSAARAFDIVLDNCKNDEACKKAYPNVKQEYKQLIARLEKGPTSIDVTHPRLGTKTELMLTKGKFTSQIRMMLYSPNMHSMIPLMINQTYLENYSPLLGFLAATSQGMGIYEAVLFNIVCNEDFPRITDAQWAEDAKNPLDGELSQLAFTAVCQLWPKYQVSEAFFQPVTADIPTLILSGNMDPVTPPSNGDHSDKTLPNSRHIVDMNSAHIVNTTKCSSKMIREFFDNIDPQAVDASCLEDSPKPSFVPSLNGGFPQ